MSGKWANGQFVIQLMEQLAPKHLALPDDRIGLQLGTLQKEVRRVLVALDVTAEVVAEAVAKQVDVIIAHHAVIFRPLTHLQTDTPDGKLYETLIKHDIAVYIAHTNLDVAAGGVNDLLAAALALRDTQPLDTSHTEKLKKLVVYVPHAQHEAVRAALFRAGAGWLRGVSQYSHCSFNMPGQGTFYPLAGANPHIGSVGKLETVDEMRVETVFSERLQHKVVQALIKTHPYEEVAYDIYTLDNSGLKMGLGRVGKLPDEMTLEALCERVKAAFSLDAVKVSGNLQRVVRNVAVLGGSGARYIRHAQFAGAEVLITGDLDHHSAHAALAAGLCLIDAGHHIEQILKPAVAASLAAMLAEAGYATQVEPSAISTNPFRTV